MWFCYETSTVIYAIYVSGRTLPYMINSHKACPVKLFKCFCKNQTRANLDQCYLFISIKIVASINIETTQNKKFCVKNLSWKCDQMHNFLCTWSNLLKTHLLKRSFFVQCSKHNILCSDSENLSEIKIDNIVIFILI